VNVNGYILVDSRTGLTGTSGICTRVMPDKLVAVFVPNAVSETAEELDRFYLTHRRCGALTSGLHGNDAVWMSCSCGATILVRAREEGTEPDIDPP